MSKIAKDLLISILVFFGIVIVLGYIGFGMEGARAALTDPINWVVVILVSIGAIIYRRNKQKREEEEAI